MKSLSTLCFYLLTASLLAQAPQASLASRDYADLLEKSLRFFDAQACGPEVDSYSSFDWRGDCHTDDGNTVINDNETYDLTGGWHDAGDHVKFNYPMAQAVYNLASLYVDHRDRVDATSNRAALLKHLRFIGDYMIKCHPEANKYVIQIATGQRDHTETPWQVPEANTYTRRVYFADTGQPNTNLACANAAAFATLSMAFRGVDDDYSAELLQHARELFDFGVDYKRSYGDNTELPTYEFNLYGENNTYWDEIMVGAAWLYRATGEQRYRTEFDNAVAADSRTALGNWAPGWGDNQYEATYQMAKATGSATYRDRVRGYLTGILNGSNGSVSPGKMWYVGASSNGFHLPASLGAANLAYRFANLVGSSDGDYNALRRFAFSQVNYTLGDNPRNGSYVIDFGSNFPRVTHHRSATAGNKDAAQDPRILTGALVMGPLGDDTYLNDRNQIKCTEPALGNNSALALAAVLMSEETNATSNPPTGGNGGTIVVRVRGNCGSETFQLRIDGQTVLSRTATTSYADYTYADYSGGTVSVHFTNDGNSNGCDRNLFVDYVDVCGTRIQSESSQVVQTSTWTNGDKQGLYTNGNNNYGNPGCATSNPTGPVIVRAKSSQGSERMRLQVDGKVVKTWTNISTSPTNYRYDGYGGGTIRVVFDNDGGQGTGDRNLAIDYIRVCGTTIQSNATGVSRTGCGTNNDQGFAWLYCNGNFNFGNPGCSSSARSIAPISNQQLVSEAAAFDVYPNPARGQLTVEGPIDFDLELFDLNGRLILRQQQLSGRAQIELAAVKPGLYLVHLSDLEGSEVLSRRIVVE